MPASLIELAAASALMFFLPGLAAVLAFAEKDSRWRKEVTELIAASVGISVALSIILLFLMTFLSGIEGKALDFTLFIAALVAVTGILLMIAASGIGRKFGSRKGGENGNDAGR